MTWEEVRTINANPLVTIGAHTSGHYAIAKLSEERMHDEVATNLVRLEEELGERPTHFSYPYGCANSAGPREFAWLKSLGMKTAVTTRKGMIFDSHKDHLTALPRFSLNGDFQDVRHLEVLLSGAPFALLNKGRRLNVA
jgi:peptidoglycan/xylan/chitin deacetylase (PgdA/CDA1 family)